MASNPSTTIPDHKPFAPAEDPKRITGEEAAKGERTVTMVFPRPVILSTQDGRRVEYQAGINEVPEELASHEWLKHNGVKEYDKGREISPWMRANPPAEPAADTVMTQGHVDFLQSRGYRPRTVADAQSFFGGLDPKHRAGFLAEAAEFMQQQGQAQRQLRVQAGEAGYTDPAPGGQKPLQPHEVRVNQPDVPPRAIKPGEHTSVGIGDKPNQAEPGRTNQQTSQGGPTADSSRPQGQQQQQQQQPQLKTAAELNTMSKPDLINYSKSVNVELDPAVKKEDMIAKLMATQHAHK